MQIDSWTWMWMVLAAVLMISEIFTTGFFLLPFGIGAAAAAILSGAGVDLAWQWVAFIGVAVISLVLLRRFAPRITFEPAVRIGSARLVGERGIVIEDVADDRGLVRVRGEEWRADAPSGPLPEGARVVVEAVEGTRLVVRPVPSEGPLSESSEEE